MSALAEVASRLRCPHCAAPFALNASLTCEAGHSFDVARQGYVSLGTGPGDTAEMVAAREAFLGAGHFAPITEVVASAHAGELVVELGAGTGHHLAALLERSSAHGIALDTSKPALRRAARAHPRLAAVACDVWAALPVQDGAADLVVDVFAPRNGPEIARILSGTLLVITPTQDHLAELIEPLGLLDVDPGKPARLHASVEPLRARTHDRVDWTMALGHADVRALVAMGPSAHHLPGDIDGRIARLPDPVQVTASVAVDTFTGGELVRREA